MPHAQEKLHTELSDAVASIGDGAFTPEVLDRKHVPYLYAVIRESHRLTPSSVVASQKRIDKEIEVNGVKLRSGEVVMLEAYTTCMDERFVDSPHDFIPERWLPDAVEARKGTEKEMVDHPFFRDPFSQGARKCPGSRVAANEIQIMIAQLVLDWNMESAVKQMEDIEYSQRSTIELDIPDITFQSRM